MSSVADAQLARCIHCSLHQECFMVILCFLTYCNYVHVFKKLKIVPAHLLYILFALLLQSLAVFTIGAGVHAAFVSIQHPP